MRWEGRPRNIPSTNIQTLIKATYRSKRPSKQLTDPNSHQSNLPIPIQIVKPPSSTSPTHSAMEIDVIGTRQDKRNPFPAIRSICIQRGLCFRCLQPFDVKTHMVDGERCCPNKKASPPEKLALIANKPNKKKSIETSPHRIAALSIGSNTENLDAEALSGIQEEERDAVGWMVKEFLSGWSDDNYPPKSDLHHPIEVNAVRLDADGSYPRRVVIPFNLKSAAMVVQTMALLT